MRIFVAGASGALGRRLVPLLVEAGHEVVGSTRTPAKTGEIAALGAEPVVMDGLDQPAVGQAVQEARPDVVIHQLTSLSAAGNLKKFDEDFAVTNALRTRGTDSLLAAAQAAGAKRFIAQSFTGWPNERTGEGLKDESDRLDPHPAGVSRRTIAAIAHLEEATTTAAGLDGLVLRYGNFYGPGNALGKGGVLLELVHRRRLPVVGGGTGVWSFVHIDDAARATALAVEEGVPGLYNIVDDEPGPVHEWLPYLAHCIGARPPMSLPIWLARPMIGEFGVNAMTSIRGSSNAKAKESLGWRPEFSTWRDGFRTGLG